MPGQVFSCQFFSVSKVSNDIVIKFIHPHIRTHDFGIQAH